MWARTIGPYFFHVYGIRPQPPERARFGLSAWPSGSCTLTAAAGWLAGASRALGSYWKACPVTPMSWRSRHRPHPPPRGAPAGDINSFYVTMHAPKREGV